jgi:hypothetical protein
MCWEEGLKSGGCRAGPLAGGRVLVLLLVVCTVRLKQSPAGVQILTEQLHRALGAGVDKSFISAAPPLPPLIGRSLVRTEQHPKLTQACVLAS